MSIDSPNYRVCYATDGKEVPLAFVRKTSGNTFPYRPRARLIRPEYCPLRGQNGIISCYMYHITHSMATPIRGH